MKNIAHIYFHLIRKAIIINLICNYVLCSENTFLKKGKSLKTVYESTAESHKKK